MGRATQTAAAIAAGELTSEHAVAAALEAAERLQPTLNAFTMLFEEGALEAARAADRAARSRETLGPLHGVPVAVKDLYDVDGAVTSGCSRPYLDRAPASVDAHAVAALRAAGAIVIGKTNMHELAFGATNTASCFGPANNPWDPERIPGGSSGGSGAAVAAGIVGIALGTDTGGSIRIPSSLCGTSGLKITTGLLPLDGILPMSPSLDSPGPIASDAEDLTVAFDVLSGHAPPAEPIRRIGVPNDYFFDIVDEQVASSVREAIVVLAGTGAEVVEVPAAWAQLADDAWLILALAEFGRVHAALIDRAEELDKGIEITLRAAMAVAAEDERAARDRATAARNAFASTIAGVDVLVTPATPCTASRHTDETLVIRGVEFPVQLGAQSHFTRPISTVGAPAVVVPCGFGGDGMPFGVQIIGRPGSESTLLALARAYQVETGWHARVAPVHA